MGNNTSAIPGRRLSVHRDSNNKDYSIHHVEYAGKASNPVNIRKSNDKRKQIGLKSDNDNDNSYIISNTLNSKESGTLLNYKQDNGKSSSKVTTPNMFLDNLVDHDYFGERVLNDTTEGELGQNNRTESQEITNIIRASEIYDNDDDYDDDGYVGIDDDLISSTTPNTDRLNKVLIKFENFENDLKSNDSVYIVGSFNQWTRKIKLEPEFKDGVLTFFKTLLLLPFGVYKLKFIINNEIRYSEKIPMATDKMGNVVNWFEVAGSLNPIYVAGANEANRIFNNKQKSLSILLNNSNEFKDRVDGVEKIKQSQNNSTIEFEQDINEYSQEVPTIFKTSLENEENDDDELLPADEELLQKYPIPELPVYLNNHYLNQHFNTHHNNNSADETNKLVHKTETNGLNSHIMPHVNLNHLLTSNIKNNTLSVACTTRYVGKFLTMIMYSPSEYDL